MDSSPWIPGLIPTTAFAPHSITVMQNERTWPDRHTKWAILGIQDKINHISSHVWQLMGNKGSETWYTILDSPHTWTFKRCSGKHWIGNQPLMPHFSQHPFNLLELEPRTGVSVPEPRLPAHLPGSLVSSYQFPDSMLHFQAWSSGLQSWVPCMPESCKVHHTTQL